MKKKNLRIWLALSALALSQIMCLSSDTELQYNITVYEDTNRNGQRDNGEPGFPGVRFLIDGRTEFQGTNENGYVRYSRVFYEVEACINETALTVIVPPNYMLTEDGSEKNPWDCIMVGDNFLDLFQAKDFVFGLAPIPLTVDADPDMLQVAPTEAPTEDPASPSLTLTKTPKPNFYTGPGQTIVYTYVFENTGNVNLAGPFVLEDDKIFKFECENDLSTLTLPPGETSTCFGSYMTSNGQGTIVNIAKIAVTYNGQTVEAEARADVYYVEPSQEPEDPDPLPTEDACEGPPYPEGCDPPPDS